MQNFQFRTPLEPPQKVFACLVQHIAVRADKTPQEGMWVYGGLVVKDSVATEKLGIERALRCADFSLQNKKLIATGSTRKIDTPVIRLAYFDLQNLQPGMSASLLADAFNLIAEIDVDQLKWGSDSRIQGGHILKQAEATLPSREDIIFSYKGSQTAACIDKLCSNNRGEASDLHALNLRLKTLESPLRYFVLQQEEGLLMPVWKPYPSLLLHRNTLPVVAVPLIGSYNLTDKDMEFILIHRFSKLSELGRITSCQILSPDGLPCILANDVLPQALSRKSFGALLQE